MISNGHFSVVLASLFEMLKSLFFVGLLWLSYVLARLDSLYQVENLSRPPAPWCSSRAASPSHRFQLSISGHKSRSIEEAIYSISTPGNERYARHLTQVEGQALLSADTEQRDVILSWLTASNVSTSDIKEDGHWIRFNATVEQANSMLAADFTWFRNLKTGGESLRTLRYSIPQKFRHTISLVHPTTRFGPGEAVQRSSQHQELRRRGLMQPRRVVESFARKDNHIINRATLDPSCNITITPSCIRSLYNIPTNITTSNARGVGVYASQSQVAKFTDFSIFTQNFIPEAAGVSSSSLPKIVKPPLIPTSQANFTFLSINNDTTSQDDLIDSDVETNFDIQYAAGLSFPIPALIFSIGGQGPLVPELGNHPGDGSEPYLQWLDSILALPDDQLPHTITTSFGEDEQSLPDGYIQQVCNQFGALGARGVSFIAASGDSGPGAACVTNDGRNATRFTPIFPGTCPYVTAVGGVQGVAPERASVFSAGGFSDRFTRPAYQDAAVSEFLGGLGG